MEKVMKSDAFIITLIGSEVPCFGLLICEYNDSMK